jgi:hypothetical protein
MTKDKEPVDINEARKHRAEILQQYGDPFDGFVDAFEAGWRAVWADVCKRKGKTIPFEEWFTPPMKMEIARLTFLASGEHAGSPPCAARRNWRRSRARPGADALAAGSWLAPGRKIGRDNGAELTRFLRRTGSHFAGKR